MMKLKKLACAWMTAGIVVCAAAFPVSAASPALVVDEADILTDKEESTLENQLEEIQEIEDCDIVVWTVTSLDGAPAKETAADYYDACGYSTDGILLLVSVEDGEWAIATSGYGITAFTDAGQAYMAEQFTKPLKKGNYAKAFQTYGTLCDDFLTQADTGTPYDTGNLPRGSLPVLRNLLIALAVGVVAAFLIVSGMKRKLKTVQMQETASDYTKENSMRLSAQRDIFLYKKVEREKKEQQNNSGSSTFTSESGETHGGSSGKF